MRTRSLLSLPVLVMGSALILGLGLCVGFLSPFTPPAHAAASLELYGTFHAMGVIITLGPADDPDGDATTSVAYRVSGSGSYQSGFPLSRVSSTRFVGSLFWLELDTVYDVRVTFKATVQDVLPSGRRGHLGRRVGSCVPQVWCRAFVELGSIAP